MAKRPEAKPRTKALPPDPEGLTFRQRQFVSFFLGEANGNATEAARLAGYSSPKQQGTENLSKPSIAAAVAAKLEGPALHADEVLARLSDMASVDMADFVTAAGPHYQVDVAKAIRNGKSHLIKKLTPTKYGVGIELHDAQSALEKLGRYYGLFRDKIVLTAEAEPSKTKAKLEQIAAGNHEPGDGPGGT